MHENLFRGRRINNGEWIEGNLFHHSDGKTEIFLSKEIFFAGRYIEGTWHEVSSSTVGQYTGLTDKNGKKIFEGDILSFKFEQIGGQEAIVEYSAKAHAFLMTPLNDFQFAMMYEGKVIGNIHDDPELLKEASNAPTD